MKTLPADDLPPSFAALIGIDWADQKHDVCLKVFGSQEVEHFQLDHTPERLNAWAGQLRRRFGGRSLALCME